MNSPPEPAPCPFCFPAEGRIAFEDRPTRAFWDAFPVSEGHLLIVPRRYVPTWFDASEEERAAITRAIDRGRELMESRHHPDGFNIGANVGEAAGQTVFHLHIHLIPRYKGDVPDPRGGVRHVIPGKGNYLASGPTTAPRLAVGFVMPSGLAKLEPHLRDFPLPRHHRARSLIPDHPGPR